MAKQDDSPLEITYTGLWIHKRDDVFLRSIIDEYADESPDHAMVFRRNNGRYTQLLINNAIGSMCVFEEITPKLFCMGVNGEITVATLPGVTTEIVDASDDGPNYALLLRCIRPIGTHLYVAGMARQFYRRESPGHWARRDQGVFVPRERRTQPVGFHAFDGLHEQAIYAVGQLGEIWFYDGQVWTQQDSLTNVALTCVRCAEDGQVYVAGLAGLLLRGQNGIWEVIEHEATTDDFWGIAWFGGRLYLSSYEGIFVLDGNTLHKLDLNLDEGHTTAYLDARDGVLWSVGHKHLAVTSDGLNWIRILGPTD